MLLPRDCIEEIYKHLHNTRDRKNFRKAVECIYDLESTEMDKTCEMMESLLSKVPKPNVFLDFYSITLDINEHKRYLITKTTNIFDGMYDIELSDALCYIPALDMYMAPNDNIANSLMLISYPAERKEIYHVCGSRPYCSVSCMYNGIHLNHPLSSNTYDWPLKLPYDHQPLAHWNFDASWSCPTNTHII